MLIKYSFHFAFFITWDLFTKFLRTSHTYPDNSIQFKFSIVEIYITNSLPIDCESGENT